MLFLIISSKTFMAKTFRRRGLLLVMVITLIIVATGSLSTTARAVLPEANCPPGLVPLSDTASRNTAIARLNFYRARINADVGVTGTPIPPVIEDVVLSQNAQNHAYYLYANSDNAAVNPVVESTANPCYTGAGALGGIYSVIRPGAPWLSDNASNGVVTPTKTIDNMIDGVFDRLFLLNPKLNQVGIGTVVTGETRYLVEAKSSIATSTIYPTVFYPSANQLNVPAKASPTEYPNNIFKNAGYPISVQYDNSVTFLGGTYAVFNATTGLALGPDDLYVIPPGAIEYEAIPRGSLIDNSLILVPKLPLLAGNTYTVIITSDTSAGRFDRTWSFTVAGSIATSPTPGTSTPGTPTLGPPPPILPTLLPQPPTPTPTPGFPAYPIIQPTPATESGGGYFEIKEAGGTNPAFYRLWRRADDPIKLGRTNSRSWTWGPDQYGIRVLLENYNNTLRLVNYHDKARMEITNPNGDPAAPGYVTNGLLVREMIAGNAQVGDNLFIPRPPAYNITVVGDENETNITAPTYYSFYNIASLNNNRRVDNQTGQTVVATIARDGTISVNLDSGGYGVINAYYDNNLGHNIPNVFWNFMNQTGTVNVDGNYFEGQVTDWVSTFGLPLTEAYWTQAYVSGVQRDVLVQMFERRVLTFTPSNPDPFKVEMGNVGRHYLKWRYNIDY